MTSGDWRPANAVEQAMAEALQQGQWRRYADLLAAEPLVIPDLPAPDTAAAERLSALLPPYATYVPVYTSVESMTFALGVHTPTYEVAGLAAVRQRWPSADHQLAVDPGTPIGVFLPLPAVEQLAAGEQSLVSLDTIRTAAADEALAQLRAACLRDLAGEQPEGTTAPPPPAPGPGPGADGSPLAARLRDAAEAGDSDAFLATLLCAEVVVATTAPVPDPEQLYGDEFPWRVVGGEQAPAVPVFSSVAALAATGAPTQDRVEAHFLDVLANWPDEQAALVFDPGTATELILPGAAVRDLVDAVLDSVDRPEGDQPRGDQPQGSAGGQLP